MTSGPVHTTLELVALVLACFVLCILGIPLLFIALIAGGIATLLTEVL